ncbi:hypothetical protein Zmor_013531 [Zophobas morio]|uniref:Uncharacterized protein n=1 Tax=Zophobas morio TaxID=2755281 RepID=A0AA38MFM3_9CUCU|nr:hypothetical protein Zmor_013531 [Zophobas morio]
MTPLTFLIGTIRTKEGVVLRKKAIRRSDTAPMGFSMYGNDDSWAGRRSQTKSLEAEVAMGNPEKPRRGVLDPSRGTY